MKLPFLQRDISKRAAAIAVALVAAAGVVAGREKPALSVVEIKAPALERVASASPIGLEQLKRSEPSAPQSDPFAPRSFAPPARPVPAASAAPPSAPPLPFSYSGRLIANGKTETFVTRGDELVSIAPGASIDGEYRVESISESSIVFTYLPLKTRQSLELAEAGG
jgi:hypothetical protein